MDRSATTAEIPNEFNRISLFCERNVSQQTFRRTFFSVVLRGYRLICLPTLASIHHRKCMCGHIFMAIETNDERKRFVWTNESNFCLLHADKRTHVRSLPRKRKDILTCCTSNKSSVDENREFLMLQL